MLCESSRFFLGMRHNKSLQNWAVLGYTWIYSLARKKGFFFNGCTQLIKQYIQTKTQRGRSKFIQQSLTSAEDVIPLCAKTHPDSSHTTGTCIFDQCCFFSFLCWICGFQAFQVFYMCIIWCGKSPNTLSATCFWPGLIATDMYSLLRLSSHWGVFSSTESPKYQMGVAEKETCEKNATLSAQSSSIHHAMMWTDATWTNMEHDSLQS